jgi:hypothetical protein
LFSEPFFGTSKSDPCPILAFFLAQGWETTNLNSLGYKEGSFPEAERRPRSPGPAHLPRTARGRAADGVSAIAAFLS